MTDSVLVNKINLERNCETFKIQIFFRFLSILIKIFTVTKQKREIKCFYFCSCHFSIEFWRKDERT